MVCPITQGDHNQQAIIENFRHALSEMGMIGQPFGTIQGAEYLIV